MRSLIFALLALLTTPAQAQSDWIFLDETRSGMKFYLRSGSIHEVAGAKRAWLLINLPKPDKDGVLSVIYLKELRCETKQSRAIQESWFKGPMGSGEARVVRGEDSWLYAVPGSVDESIMVLVCGR